MKFSTPVTFFSVQQSISHDAKLLILGSCFAENMGEKLSSNKFNTVANPFGIIYNPISIANSLTHILNEYDFNPSCRS
ncbi:MAG: GSCFA domain-containing protein [Vicingaceae bacterium]|nr:GSCFA domain-containing protein [Vicingaceae bacterium]